MQYIEEENVVVCMVSHIVTSDHQLLLICQIVDELFAYWTLEDSEDTLEQLEELLIVSTHISRRSE